MQYGITGDEYKYKNISLNLHFFSEFSPLLEGRFHTRILFQNKKNSSWREKVKVSDFDILL